MIGRGVSVILIILILNSPYLILQTSDCQQYNSSLEIGPGLSITSSIAYNSSVIIASDSDFVLQGWPGNGTKSSPYLISNLRFRNTEDRPIQIGNIQAYFMVNNCVIDPPEIGQPASDSVGITFIDVSNGIVENCEFNAIGYGIAVWSLNDTTIKNNRFSGCGFSLYIGHDLLRCNISENTIVECAIGIDLSSYCINNTLWQNRIGWCTDTNAWDSGSGNLWIGNSWSDWDGVGSYMIPGSAGSIDYSPTLIDEDVLAPAFEYNLFSGYYDLIEPIYSFTFATNVTDASGVASVSLFIREMHMIDDLHFQFQWVEYIMEHQPLAGNPDRYAYTFDCNGSFSATYVFYAIDILGYSRFTRVESFSLGCCLTYYTGCPLSAVYFTLFLFGAAALIILVSCLVKRNKMGSGLS